MPTGDPKMPPSVKRAIHIEYKIKDKVDMEGDAWDGEDSDDNDTDPSSDIFSTMVASSLRLLDEKPSGYRLGRKRATSLRQKSAQRQTMKK
jgi:hypothetical protein